MLLKFLSFTVVAILFFTSAVFAFTNYSGAWEGWLIAETSSECGFSQVRVSMDVENQKFIIRAKDAVEDRDVIGSIFKNKIEQRIPFSIINEFDTEFKLGTIKGFFDLDEFNGTVLVETISPGAFSASVMFCEANTRLRRSGPIAFGIRQNEIDDYLNTIKIFYEKGALSKQEFTEVRNQIGVGKTDQAKVNDAGKLESKLERFKDLFEKELITKEEYQKMKKKLLGIE